MRVVAVSILAVLAAAVAHAAESVPDFKPGTAYSSARGTLITKGFRPIRSSGAQRDDRCSAGRQDVCEAYPETVSCSGTGSAPCRFIFSAKDGTTLTIVADGEDAGRLRIATVRRSSKDDAAWQRTGR